MGILWARREEDTDNGPVLQQTSYREGRGRGGRGQREEGRGKRCAKDGVVAAEEEEDYGRTG
jgi:hypothetical protein